MKTWKKELKKIKDRCNFFQGFGCMCDRSSSSYRASTTRRVWCWHRFWKQSKIWSAIRCVVYIFEEYEKNMPHVSHVIIQFPHTIQYNTIQYNFYFCDTNIAETYSKTDLLPKRESLCWGGGGGVEGQLSHWSFSQFSVPNSVSVTILIHSTLQQSYVRQMRSLHAEVFVYYFVSLGYGGPHAGFFAIRDIGNLKRSLPGRLIGITRCMINFTIRSRWSLLVYA